MVCSSMIYSREEVRADGQCGTSISLARGVFCKKSAWLYLHFGYQCGSPYSGNCWLLLESKREKVKGA